MKYVIGITIFLIGICLGVVLRHYHGIPLEDKINIVDVVTLIVTIFLAFYIPYFLDKYVADKRSEKDVLIRKVEQLQNSFKDVNGVVDECYQKGVVSHDRSQFIISRFTAISRELETAKTLIDHCLKDKFKTEVNTLVTYRRRYKNIVTGGRFQQSNYKYDAMIKAEEEKMFATIDKEICLLIIKINAV